MLDDIRLYSNLIFKKLKMTRWYDRSPVHMMTSSNGNISALLALCEGNPPVNGGFSSQRPVMRGFDVFFDLRLKKRLGKQSRRRWFQTPSRSSWRHCNEIKAYVSSVVEQCSDYTGITIKSTVIPLGPFIPGPIVARYCKQRLQF